MARKIEIDIDLSKIDKSKIKVHQNGGKYYRATLVEKKTDKSDWIIFEKQSKEESEAKGGKGTILGNGKNFGWEGSGSSAQSGGSPSGHVSSDDLPF